MNHFFLICFFIFSSLLFSQSSYQSAANHSKGAPTFIEKNAYAISQFSILDKDFLNTINNNWLLKPLSVKNNNNNVEFSSLTLIKQLEELNHTTPFELSHNPTLERFIRVYLKTRRDDISDLMDRATYYFPLFEEYLDKYDLPLEIKYLAVIESALKSNAVSPTGAKGLWQFILATGKQYGLEVNSYVDDRFDVIKSTESACMYLSDLYKMFGDWDLALAAYNAGPGNVRKAIKRANGNTNYWEIRPFLPEETRGYLPAFYATFYIFEYAETHQLKPSNSELIYYETDTVHLKQSLTFTHIQKNIAIKKEILKALNPQYKRDVIPYSKNKKYVLTLPKSLIDSFIEKENTIYQNPTKTTSTSNRIIITQNNSYIVKQGDNLNSIAKMHHITLEQLKSWNGLETNYLISSQRLVVTNKKI